MEKYQIKYALIALISLVPVVYSHLYQLSGHEMELLRGFFLGALGFSLIILYSKSRSFHKMFLYTIFGCVLAFFLRISPNLYDALGIAMVALGALPVYLMAICLDKKKRL
jgi:hypothetical protein